MRYHELEYFGVAGCFVAVLLPDALVGVLLVVPAGICVLVGQSLRHKRILEENHDDLSR